MLGDQTEEDWSGQVLGAQSARGHGGEEIDGGGLATLGLGGSELQARAVGRPPYFIWRSAARGKGGRSLALPRGR